MLGEPEEKVWDRQSGMCLCFRGALPLPLYLCKLQCQKSQELVEGEKIVCIEREIESEEEEVGVERGAHLANEMRGHSTEREVT